MHYLISTRITKFRNRLESEFLLWKKKTVEKWDGVVLAARGIEFSRLVTGYFPCRGYSPIFIERKRAGTSVSGINITLYQ